MDTAEPTDKAALITRQREARIRGETLVDAIPVERVADPALAEGRSVKDVVAHLAAWDEWSADRIGLRLRGEVPPPIGEWEPFEHGFNLRVAAEMRDRPWSAVQQEARSAYDRFAARLEALPETELFGDRPLWPLIRGNGYGHYEDFIAPLRAFVEQIPPALHLTTERLIIRSFKPSDAESIFAMFADPEVVRYLPAMPELTLERSRDVVDRRIARERRNGFGLWVVELKDTGRYIGSRDRLRPAARIRPKARSRMTSSTSRTRRRPSTGENHRMWSLRTTTCGTPGARATAPKPDWLAFVTVW